MLANYSVWQAAREAADRDFGVIVVMDCCASETFAWHTQLRVGVRFGQHEVERVGIQSVRSGFRSDSKRICGDRHRSTLERLVVNLEVAEHARPNLSVN